MPLEQENKSLTYSDGGSDLSQTYHLLSVLKPEIHLIAALGSSWHFNVKKITS